MYIIKDEGDGSTYEFDTEDVELIDWIEWLVARANDHGNQASLTQADPLEKRAIALGL